MQLLRTTRTDYGPGEQLESIVPPSGAAIPAPLPDADPDAMTVCLFETLTLTRCKVCSLSI